MPARDTDVEFTSAEWIDCDNHRRLHGILGHTSPAEIVLYRTRNGSIIQKRSPLSRLGKWSPERSEAGQIYGRSSGTSGKIGA